MLLYENVLNVVNVYKCSQGAITHIAQVLFVTGGVYGVGLLSLILKSLIKSLMPKAPVGASIRLLHSKGCC